MLPIQERIAQRNIQEEQSQEWKQAALACEKNTSGMTTVSKDKHGAVYCISHAGKVLATISEQEK